MEVHASDEKVHRRPRRVGPARRERTGSWQDAPRDGTGRPSVIPDFAAERDAGRDGVVALRGELDLASAPVLRQCLAEVIDSGQTDVVVDLSGLTFLDSTGISVLVAAHQQLRRREGRLVVADPAPQARRVLEISGLLAVFGVADPGSPA